MFVIFKVLSIASILMCNFNVGGQPLPETNEDAVLEAVQPTSIVEPPVQNQQESPQTSEFSVIDDCDIGTPTEILNEDHLIVDHKYAHFHHDAEDVQENSTSFMDEQNLEPKELCEGESCSAIGQTVQHSSL